VEATAISRSLYLAAFLPVLAGISTPVFTLPPSQDSLAGSPATALLEDSVHSVAPETVALTMTVPSEGTLAGAALKFEITGFEPFATAVAVLAHRHGPIASPTHTSVTRAVPNPPIVATSSRCAVAAPPAERQGRRVM